VPKKILAYRVLGSVIIQLYAGECTPSVDRAYVVSYHSSVLIQAR